MWYDLGGSGWGHPSTKSPQGGMKWSGQMSMRSLRRSVLIDVKRARWGGAGVPPFTSALACGRGSNEVDDPARYAK